MSHEKKVSEALSKAEKETKAERSISPAVVLGCCTISSGGYSEQKPNISSAACDNQGGPGVTVTWASGRC